MKFGELLEDFLTELSGTEIYQKFYSKIEYSDFLQIVRSDPRTVFDDGELKKLGKYSKLLLLLYQRGGLPIEDLDKASEYLEYVYEHNIPLDFNKIKKLVDLYDVVKDYIAKDAKTFQEVLNVLPQNEYQLLYDGQNWQFYKPLTEKASCYLGVNTEWCTTWGPYSLNKKHRSRGNLFQKYHHQGPLFIVVNKNDTNEKYQFHFESKQFMDKEDRRINTNEFFEDKNKKEILRFFFPSFFIKTTKEQLEIEIKRIDLLPKELGTKLFERAIGTTDNPLINAIMKKDYEMLDTVLSDAGVEISNSEITFTVDEISSDIEDLERNLSWYAYESSNGWDFVYDDMRDRGIEDYELDFLKDFLREYYNDNQSEFSSAFGIKNFEDFLQVFFDNYLQNEKKDILDAFATDVANLSYESYEQNNESVMESIKNDIYVEETSVYQVIVNQVKFVEFLLKKGIKELNGQKVVLETIDEYISYCGHGGEFERLYDFDIKYPKYGEDNNLTRLTREYFQEMLDDSEGTTECIKLRQKLNEIVKNYFKGSTYFENEQIKVRLKSMEVDCATGMVKIEYTNKNTGETFGVGKEKDGVKVDNLVSLLTNYKLFESYFRFRKNILK